VQLASEKSVLPSAAESWWGLVIETQPQAIAIQVTSQAATPHLQGARAVLPREVESAFALGILAFSARPCRLCAERERLEREELDDFADSSHRTRHERPGAVRNCTASRMHLALPLPPAGRVALCGGQGVGGSTRSSAQIRPPAIITLPMSAANRSPPSLAHVNSNFARPSQTFKSPAASSFCTRQSLLR
jgi:hypothetical protein